MPKLALHHVAMIVTDLDKSATFYQQLFGLEQIQRPPFPIPGMWLGVGNLQVHLTVYAPGNFRSGQVDNDDVHFAFNTRDFEGFVDQAHAMGFSEDAPRDDPKHMILKRQGIAGFPQLYLMDPDRNIIEVNGAPT